MNTQIIDQNTSCPTSEDHQDEIHLDLLNKRPTFKKVCGIQLRFKELGLIHLLTIIVIFGLPYVGLCYDFYEQSYFILNHFHIETDLSTKSAIVNAVVGPVASILGLANGLIFDYFGRRVPLLIFIIMYSCSLIMTPIN